MSAPPDDGGFSAPTLHTATRRTGGAAPISTSTSTRPAASGRSGSSAPVGAPAGPPTGQPTGVPTGAPAGAPAPRGTRPPDPARPRPGWDSDARPTTGVSDRRRPERGRPGWFAVGILIAIAAVGVAVNLIFSTNAGLNYGIVVAALAAILIVRRHEMFPVIVAPPLVYLLGSAGELMLRSGGVPSTKLLYDFGANWLVYGFPSIAAATAVVVIIGAVRAVARR